MKRTRLFLERVLKDERAHAARRGEEAAGLRALLEERQEVERVLAELSVSTSRAKFELNDALLDNALASNPT